MGSLIVVPGFRWSGLEAGIRKRPGRPDLALLLADEPVTAAAVFTQSDMAAAPVLLSREVAARGKARAVLMNAGCANACTGEAGLDAARRMAASLAGSGIAADEVLIASTGVIGALLPAEKIGVSLTTAHQLVPEQSTAAIVVHHPEAKYFSIGSNRERADEDVATIAA